MTRRSGVPADNLPRRRGVRIGGGLVGMLAAVVLLGAFASSALAARGHSFERTFSGPCTLEPCEGNLKEPAGVAVNEATGQVYVVDKGANRVARFSASGSYEGEFDGSGSLPGEGAAAGSGAGEIASGRFDEPEGIAVDNTCFQLGLSGSECAAQDPGDGDVYVVDTGHRVVDRYTAEGGYVGQISVFEGFLQPLEGVATSPGAVWVYAENKSVARFTTAIPNEAAGQTEIQLTAVEQAIPGIAVYGHQGTFYVRHSFGVDRSGRIAKADSTGKLLTGEVDPEPSSDVAVDQAEGTAFVDNLTTIGVFDPTGRELERLGDEEGTPHLTQGAGVGVDSATDSLYVADAGARDIVVFGPVNPSAPTVESSSASEITGESALLEAELTPRSDDGDAATGYHFEYGACASPDSCAISGYEGIAPVPDGQVGPDFEVHTVAAQVTGLRPATTYHFRLLAHNGIGPVAGPEATFVTQAAGGELVLPDQRQWQMVSPPRKLGARIEPIKEVGVVEAANDGDGITYATSTSIEPHPLGNASHGLQVLSTRGTTEWSTRDITLPHLAAAGDGGLPSREYQYFSPTLSLAAVQPSGQFNPALSAEASESTAYLRNLSATCADRCYRPLVTGKPGFANVPEGTEFGEEGACAPSASSGTTTGALPICGPRLVAAAEDLGQIVLQSTPPLMDGAGSGQLYEWSNGELLHISVLPGIAEEPAVNPFLGSHLGQAARRAISTDGTRIEWEDSANLYQRDTQRDETVQLDEGEGCAECSSGGGEFQIASADGRRVFFTDTRRLTSDSGAGSEGSEHGADLYECRMVLGGGELHCELSDLTPESGGEGANVLGQLLGASEDGEDLYFVARGVQSGPNPHGQSPTPGAPNLYERHGSSTIFIATLSGGDLHDWGTELGGGLAAQPTRVSPDGRFLELMSQTNLSGYDNRDAATGQPAAEVYFFDAESDRLECASCDPTGARPTGVEYRKLEPGSGGLVGGPRGIWPPGALVAANVPGTLVTGLYPNTGNRYQPRYLSNSGRLFFNTVNGLVPQDSNGNQDVYEYEPPGVGSCTGSSPTFGRASGGCVSLISSGTSGEESGFLDASETGDDVFFLTYSRLSPLDTDNQLDVYDAHSCEEPAGCLPEVSAATTEPCQGQNCQSPGGPPSEPQPASQSFSGEGNPKPAKCRKGHAKKHGRCVKKQKHKKHKGKKHKKKNGHGNTAKHGGSR